MTTLVKVADLGTTGIPTAETGWTIWIDEKTAYHVSHAENSSGNLVTDLTVYKTVDGGLTWDGGVDVPGTGELPIFLNSAVWFDKWTPGDSGTKIHFCTIVAHLTTITAEYVSFDVASDTFSIPVDLGAAGVTSGGILGEFGVSITKSRSGNLTAMGWQGNGAGENFTRESLDAGATWSPIATGVLNNDNDFVRLVPGNEADTDDVYVLYWDRTAQRFQLRHYDRSLDTWAVGVIFRTVNERAGEYHPFSVSVRKSDGHVFVTWFEVSVSDATKDDIRIFEVRSANDALVQDIIDQLSTFNRRTLDIFVDQATGDVYLHRPDGNQIVKGRSTNNALTFSTERFDIGEAVEVLAQTVSIESASPPTQPLVAQLGSSPSWLYLAATPTVLDPEKETDILANYLPSGRAFGAKNVGGTVTRDLLKGLAGEMVRSTDLIKQFQDEILPDLTVRFLNEWESALGIPDDCFLGNGTDDERRRDILVKLVSLGVQTKTDMVTLANLLGVTVTITAGSVHGVFPFVLPLIFFPTPKDARFTIVVDFDVPIGARFPYTFPLPFSTPGLAVVECLFRKVKPANVDLLFTNL